MASKVEVKEVKKSACVEVEIVHETAGGQVGQIYKVVFKYEGKPQEGWVSLGGTDIPVMVLDAALMAFKEQYPFEME